MLIFVAKNTKRQRVNFQKVLYALSLGLLLAVPLLLTAKVPEVSAHLYGGLSVLDHQVPIVEYKGPPCIDEPPGSGTGDPEFHSLRPYQTGRCGDSPKTYFCFNNYNLIETLHTTWGLDCIDGGAYYSCPVDEQIDKVYVVDGEYARFPIMGNTEQVTNSQGPE